MSTSADTRRNYLRGLNWHPDAIDAYMKATLTAAVGSGGFVDDQWIEGADGSTTLTATGWTPHSEELIDHDCRLPTVDEWGKKGANDSERMVLNQLVNTPNKDPNSVLRQLQRLRRAPLQAHVKVELDKP